MFYIYNALQRHRDLRVGIFYSEVIKTFEVGSKSERKEI